MIQEAFEEHRPHCFLMNFPSLKIGFAIPRIETQKELGWLISLNKPISELLIVDYFNPCVANLPQPASRGV